MVMTLAFCLIMVEITAVLLLFPVKFALKTHFSLNESKMLVELKLFGVSVIRLKCVAKGDMTIYINGKRKTHSGGGISLDGAKMLVALLKSDISQSYMLAHICGDAKDCAIVCALLNILPIKHNFTYFGAGKDKLDIDMHAVLVLNIIEIASIALACMDRRKYAEF